MWAKLSVREKKLVVVLFVLVTIMVFYQFIWQVQYPRYVSLKETLLAEKAKLEQAESIAVNWPDLEARRRDTESRLASIKMKFTSDLNSGMPIVEVGQRLDTLKLIGIYPAAVLEKDSFLILPLDLRLRGTYVEILEFIQAIESLPQAVSIQALGLSKEAVAPEGDGQLPGNDQVVTADLKLAFYGLKDGPVAKVSGEWSLGRFDIFSPALQDLLDASRNSGNAKPPGSSQGQTPRKASNSPGGKGGLEAVLPKDEQPEEDPYAFPVK